MKIQEEKIENRVVTQVFISQEEAEDEENQKKIEKLKKEKGNVVVFCAGNKDMEITLQGMLQVLRNNVTIN